MFLVVKYHIIRPPPPAWASLLNKPKSQKIVGHWIPKNGPKNGVPSSAWASLLNKMSFAKVFGTMNFEKFMYHEFPKIVGHWFSKNFWNVIFFLFEKFKIFKNLRNYVSIFFFYIDFVWYFDIVDFVDFLIFWFFENPSIVEKTFIFLIQSILFSG